LEVEKSLKTTDDHQQLGLSEAFGQDIDFFDEALKLRERET